MAPRLVRPNSFRLIFDAATYGDNVACGKSALNCSQRCPRAARISVFESSAPRFCFSPRSMASCKERGITPGTAFPGTDPENELPSSAPGKPVLGELEPAGNGVCPGAVGERSNRTPASRNVYLKLQMILKPASFAQSLSTLRGQHPIPTRHS